MYSAKIESSSPSSWDMSTMRYFLIIGAVAIVAGYNYVKYSNNKKAEREYK